MIQDEIKFEIDNKKVSRIKKDLKKTGLFKIGQVTKGITYSMVQVVNLYQFENWVTAVTIIKGHDPSIRGM
jgi:hypothetical protein